MAQKIVNRPVLNPPPNPMAAGRNFAGMNQVAPSQPVPMTQAAYRYQKQNAPVFMQPSHVGTNGSIDPLRYVKRPR